MSAFVIASAIAVPLGAAIAVLRFHGRRAAIVILNALLGLPPVVVGLVVYLMLSYAGPLGGFGLLFTPQAMVIAQAILVAPIVVVLTQRAVAAAAGFGVGRREVMYNDFILVGPKSDPAGVSGLRDITAALRRVAEARAAFVPRGDDSGTDKAEKRLWREAGIDVQRASGTWYRDTGSGMGQALNTAAAFDGYKLADRGTWLSFQNRRNLVLVVEGDKRLFNQYGVMLVNPARHANVKRDLGQAFIDWLVSPEGQGTIASYRINGEQLFFPNADKPSN